jgi:anti-anti-sigma factor
MAKPLHLSTSQYDGTVTVTVAGELDVATSPDLRSCLDKILLAGPGQVIIHLSNCSFIDAGGLGTLVSLKNRAKLQHTALLLGGVPARMLRLMKLIELDSRFDFLPPPPPAAESAGAKLSLPRDQDSR